MTEELKKATSIETRTSDYDLTFLRTETVGERLYDLYEDSTGVFWYSTRLMTENGPVSEYEAIFGRKERRRI